MHWNYINFKRFTYTDITGIFVLPCSQYSASQTAASKPTAAPFSTFVAAKWVEILFVVASLLWFTYDASIFMIP